MYLISPIVYYFIGLYLFQIWFELTKWIGPFKNFVQVFLLHLGKWSDVVASLHSAHGNVIDDWER